MIILGERLKALRLDRRITQVEMSKRVGISPIMISSYELDKRQPGYSVLIKLATFFGVSTDYLLGIEKERSVSVYGLNSREVEVINSMIDVLREHKPD